MTAGQHAASVSLPVRRFPSRPRQRNSVGDEAPFASSVCLRSMLRQGTWSFTKAPARRDTFPEKESNMSKIIEQSGVSIAQFNNGKITRWADYYDELGSRRVGLAAFFTEWIGY